MKRYAKIINDINKDKIYINEKVTNFLKRVDNRLHLYSDINSEKSDYLMSDLDKILNNGFDYDLIDDTFLDIIDLNNNKVLYFTSIITSLFMPIDNKYLGVYLEFFTNFVSRDLYNDRNRNLIKKLKYKKIIDLYDSYLTYRRFFSKEFNFSVDYDFPSLLFSYYYTNNLDLYEVNNVIFLYIKNRDYYLEKMAMNGLFFPFDDDDSMPKFFNNRYSEIYQYFIPVLVNDYKVKNENKKRIK